MTASRYAWEALDVLSNTTANSLEDDHYRTQKSLELMERIVAEEGLGPLVERYAKLQAPPIIRALSFLLSLASNQSPNPELCRWVLQFVNHLKCDDTTTMTNLLTALHRLAIVNLLFEFGKQPPDGLFGFIMRGLSNTIMVQSASLGLINRIYEDGFIKLLSEDEQDRLRMKIGQLRSEALPVIMVDLENLELPG